MIDSINCFNLLQNYNKLLKTQNKITFSFKLILQIK
jgi:hypothetical protein